MAQFLSELDMRQVKEAHQTDSGRPHFILLAPLLYESDVTGSVIEVPKDFNTDLASVPRFVITWLLAGGHGNRPAVVHDYLVRQPDVPRNVADKVFKEALLVIEEPRWRTWLMYLAVRIGATFNGKKV